MSKKSNKKNNKSTKQKVTGPVNVLSNPTDGIEPPKEKLKWDDITELRTFVIEMIQKPHEELINLKETCGPIIANDEELVNTFNGLNSTFKDQLEKVQEISKEHANVVKNDKGEEVLDFEKGEIGLEDVDAAMKYFAIGGKYNTLRESVEHTATVGVMNFISAIDRSYRKGLQKELGLTDEQVAQIEAEEKAKEESIKNFKETYNGESLKDDFPKALSEASKTNGSRDHSQEDVDSITSGFQKKLDGLTKEDIEKGGSITTVEELKKEGN